MAFDLLIWDCDGVLVDSEIIACRVAAETLTRMGYPVSTEEYILNDAGRTMEDTLLRIESLTGERFLDRFDFMDYRQRVMAALDAGLRPVRGIDEILGKLRVPMCVASGSSVERNTAALKKAGIYSFFEGKIYSSQQAGKGKPAPDVFLFVADKMKADPSKCLVIEDSLTGIMAGKAAGMTVFGFMGASHITPAWRDKARTAGPDLMFDDMRNLPELMEAGQRKRDGQGL